MGSLTPAGYCYTKLLPSQLYKGSYVNITNLDVKSLQRFCNDVYDCENNSETEDKYSQPMVLIGIYISIASLFCVLAMALDLLNGFRNRKFWFPTKYFSLNAASITVITVAMKLPVDLTSPMPRALDQVAKIGSLAFMCTMMSNLMPSLASMDNMTLLANVTGLSIFLITLIVNSFIQVGTRVIDPYASRDLVLVPATDAFFYFTITVAYIYIGMLLFFLVTLISSAITIPSSKKILEVKYQAVSKKALNEQYQQEIPISIVEKLRQLVERYWIMAETGSPQFVMASTPLSSASGIICAISMLMYLYMIYSMWVTRGFTYNQCQTNLPSNPDNCKSVYKQSMIPIVITQTIGVILGSIAPICRCFTVLSFKSLSNQIMNFFLVFKVDIIWTQRLYEWKHSRASFFSSGPRLRAHLYNLKNCILSLCIGFQKVIVVSCKMIGLLPIVVMIFVICCLNYFKSISSSNANTNEDLSKYVLLVEDNTQLAKKTVKRFSDSMKRLIQEAEKKQHNNLLKLLEEYVREPATSNGVLTFDNDQFHSQLSVEHVNSWSLPIISLTCIIVVIPNIHRDKVVNMFNSVGEGLLCTHLVEKTLNREPVYVNIRKATATLWREVEENYKWLDTTLDRKAYEGKTPREIVKSFAHIAEGIVIEFNTTTNGEIVEKENLPLKVIAANSMYRIAKTIMHTYESNDLAIIEDELFTRLSGMVADILAACLTNIPHAITMRCHESAIEKREASVAVAIDLLGQTTKIIEKLEKHAPSMDQDKMAYIDEWRLHLGHP